MNKIALGTVQFGQDYGIANKNGQVKIEEISSILDFALTNGINTLDTAFGYGESEKKLGIAGIKGWKVISKLPHLPNHRIDIEGWVKHTTKTSLQLLKTEKLYGLLLHRPLDLLSGSGDNLYKSLQNLKTLGFVEKIGISVYSVNELKKICSRYDFDVIQVPMNVIDWRFKKTGTLKKLKKSNIEIHIRSIFLQGLLLMTRNELNNKFNKWSLLWNRWHDWLLDYKITPLQACLSHVLNEHDIDKIIVGVDNAQHLIEIVKAAKIKTPNIPEEFISNDIELINPMSWDKLDYKI